MPSTASTVAIAMEIVAAIGRPSESRLLRTTWLTLGPDLFYDVHLSGVVAVFQIFASQMIGYGIAGIRKSSSVSSVYFLNSMIQCGRYWYTQHSEYVRSKVTVINRQMTRVVPFTLPIYLLWIYCKACIFLEPWIPNDGEPSVQFYFSYDWLFIPENSSGWQSVSCYAWNVYLLISPLSLLQFSSGNGECASSDIYSPQLRSIVRIPQYPFPLLTAISVICLVDNGRSSFIRNLFGAGSSNEGIGLLSFSTSWTLITQGNPLVWPLQTRTFINSCASVLFLPLTWAAEINSYSEHADVW